MKKFLTLALALVMALALAAPAMAFVEFDYTADSDFDLIDFYLVDYDTSSGIFNVGGVMVDLPSADRGYVTNEMVGAVAEVLVPAGHGGDKVDLLISSKNVRLVDTFHYTSKNNLKLETVAQGANRVDDYEWDYTVVGAYDEMILRNNSARGVFQNDSNKDVEAAFLVTGRVLEDEASLTATLQNAEGNFNKKLAVPKLNEAPTTATYKVGTNEYRVALEAVDTNGDAIVDNYVYTITALNGDYTGNGLAYRIYTDGSWKGKYMVVFSEEDIVDVTAAAKPHTIKITGLNGWDADADGADTNTDKITLQLTGYAAKDFDEDDYATGDAVAAAVVAEVNANSEYTAVYNSLAGEITITANAAGLEGVTGGSTSAGDGPDVDLTATISIAGATTGVTDTPGQDKTTQVGTAGQFLVNSDGKLYQSQGATATAVPTGVNWNVTGSGKAVGLANAVIRDFGLNPKLLDNLVKPEYLGQYRSGNVIEEITIDIQPWQAYVSIPDIEVIDPPKTGDAATLAGFVMIVLAAAGVVVFKKVRA